MTVKPTNTLLKSSVLSEFLENSARERQIENEHILKTDFGNIRDITEPVSWGVFSWTLRRSKLRWIRKGTALNIGYGFQTPGDIVRDYLDYYHPARLHATGSQAKLITEHKTTPLYLRPSIVADATYIDISAAYWSILKVTGWNVDYFPGRWLIPGRIPADFPLPNHKVARAILVSAGLSSRTVLWTGSEFKHVKTRNTHVNFGLWTVVQDILHSIAVYAVGLGAVYVHTDGYILPTKHAHELSSYIREWGLDAGIKGQGSACIWGFGNFWVGEKRSKRVRPYLGRHYTYLRNVPTDWLLPKVQWCLSHRRAN